MTHFTREVLHLKVKTLFNYYIMIYQQNYFNKFSEFLKLT